MSTRAEPQRLLGGTANRGRVLRVGDTVHRPVGPHTPAVHAFLQHLRQVGFTDAPLPVQADAREEVLTYVPGEAAVEPLASWALGEDTVHGVGRLLRRFHDAAAGFVPDGLMWQRPVPARWRGPLVAHNDLNPANIVFRDGAPAALIDFDLAAPATAAWDLAVTACFWAPLRDESDVLDARAGSAHHRVRALLDGYRAERALRLEVVAAFGQANAWIAGVIEDACLQGHPAFGRLWAEQAQVYGRAEAWLGRNGERLRNCVA